MSSDSSRMPLRSQSVPPTDRTYSYGNRYSSPDNRATGDVNYRVSRSPATLSQRSETVSQVPCPTGYGAYPYQYSTGGYGNQGNSLSYGFPPHNFLLSTFLTGGHYPFDFRGPWMSHQKHHNWGAWSGGRGYHKSSWGPVF